MSEYPQRPEAWECAGARALGSFNSAPCGYWRPNSDLLQRECVLVIAETCLVPLPFLKDLFSVCLFVCGGVHPQVSWWECRGQRITCGSPSFTFTLGSGIELSLSDFCSKHLYHLYLSCPSLLISILVKFSVKVVLWHYYCFVCSSRNGAHSLPCTSDLPLSAASSPPSSY